jgi:hypothetical protein
VSIVIFTGVFVVFALFVFLMIVAISGFVFYHAFTTFNRTSRNMAQSAGGNRNVPGMDGKRRALDIISQKKAQQAGQKCQYCGATIDSTAELQTAGFTATIVTSGPASTENPHCHAPYANCVFDRSHAWRRL